MNNIRVKLCRGAEAMTKATPVTVSLGNLGISPCCGGLEGSHPAFTSLLDSSEAAELKCNERAAKYDPAHNLQHIASMHQCNKMQHSATHKDA